MHGIAPFCMEKLDSTRFILVFNAHIHYTASSGQVWLSMVLSGCSTILIPEFLAVWIWNLNMPLPIFLPSFLKLQVCFNFFTPELTWIGCRYCSLHDRAGVNHATVIYISDHLYCFGLGYLYQPGAWSADLAGMCGSLHHSTCLELNNLKFLGTRSFQTSQSFVWSCSMEETFQVSDF